MIKINKNAIVTALLLSGAIGLAGCSSTSTNSTTVTKTDNSNVAVVVNSKPANANNEIAKTDEPLGKIGIPECDEYVEKFEACVKTKVPEGQRENFMSSFNSMRQAWKAISVSNDAQNKAALAGSCKQSLEASKKSMSSFACTW